MQSTAADFYDPTAEADPNWDPVLWGENYRNNMWEQVLTAYFAAQVPRRLGPDADPAQLGQDKRFSKKLTNRLIDVLNGQWDGKSSVGRTVYTDKLDTLDLTGDEANAARIRGAQVDWEEWMAFRLLHIRSSCQYVVTQAMLAGDKKLANRLHHRLTQELGQITNLYQHVYGKDLPNITGRD